MTFRRQGNRHDWWVQVVNDNVPLLAQVPASAVATEGAFRDYVTRGTHNGVAFDPAVFALSPNALDDLWVFINHKAQFDMDASRFDDFNTAFRKVCVPADEWRICVPLFLNAVAAWQR